MAAFKNSCEIWRTDLSKRSVDRAAGRSCPARLGTSYVRCVGFPSKATMNWSYGQIIINNNVENWRDQQYRDVHLRFQICGEPECWLNQAEQSGDDWVDSGGSIISGSASISSPQTASKWPSATLMTHIRKWICVPFMTMRDPNTSAVRIRIRVVLESSRSSCPGYCMSACSATLFATSERGRTDGGRPGFV